jgi:hypothetical protein
MKFQNWVNIKKLHEGYSLDSSQIPFEELKAYIDKSDPNHPNNPKMKGTTRDSLISRMKFHYTGKRDTPADFIRVVPANVTTTLPYFIGGEGFLKRSLPTFQGVRIYYGFKFVEENEYQDQYANYSKGVRGSSEQRIMQDELTRLEQFAEQYRHQYGNYAIIPEVNKHEMRNYIAIHGENYQLIADNTKRTLPNVDPQAIDSYAMLMREIYLSDSIEVLKNKFTDKENAEAYLKLIRIAFARVLKEPSTPVAKTMSRNFIKLAADNFIRWAKAQDKKYDCVTYPDSSKEFNSRLADYLAHRLNAKSVKGFEKLTGENITIDWEALNRDQPPSQVTRLKTQIGQKLKTGSKLQIKNLDQHLRRYVRQWQTAEDFAGKNILIIDDNIDQGGTFEQVHEVVQKQHPASVDIYSPLYIGHH